jgi:hypothetical protein
MTTCSRLEDLRVRHDAFYPLHRSDITWLLERVRRLELALDVADSVTTALGMLAKIVGAPVEDVCGRQVEAYRNVLAGNETEEDLQELEKHLG